MACLLLATFLSLRSPSFTLGTGTAPAPTALPYKLAVAPQPKGTFRGTDAIQIREVTGTAEHFQVGEVYRVAGVCRQETLPRATLYIGNSAQAGAEAITPAEGFSLYKELAEGATEFDCTFQVRRPGVLHVTVYNPRDSDKHNNSYAGIILGDVVFRH